MKRYLRNLEIIWNSNSFSINDFSGTQTHQLFIQHPWPHYHYKRETHTLYGLQVLKYLLTKKHLRTPSSQGIKIKILLRLKGKSHRMKYVFDILSEISHKRFIPRKHNKILQIKNEDNFPRAKIQSGPLQKKIYKWNV